MFTIDNDYIVAIRREIHEYPETDFDLQKTVAVVKRELESMGISYTQKYGKSSVAGYINPDKEGFTIGLRADMDALNITEKAQVPYKSKIEGKMHACGHDAHTAILLGAAKALKKMESEIKCRVKLLFEPSEEGMEKGAQMMCDNGVMDDVDIIIGLHIESLLDAGTMGVRSGFAQASSRNFKIEIFGESTHATTPQEGTDALGIAVRIYNDIQHFVLREIDPFENCVCSVGTLHAGTGQNNIADYAQMLGTIRVLDMNVDKFIIERLEKTVKNRAEEAGAKWKITAPLSTPSVYNDSEISNSVLRVLEKVVGKQNICEMPIKLGAEDFSYYQLRKPGCLFRLGVRNKEKGMEFDTHNSYFQLDEDVLHLGSRAFVEFVLRNMDGIVH
ncbi:MAG: amidohydrolase [Clostridia bacterium]|mgnify:CR=1 FL=1|nr:amidohydrolase [Clostridia bacterium]